MNSERWVSLMSRLKFSDNTATFQSLEQAYSESHRFYHTGRHIDAMLDHFNGVREQAGNVENIEVAIWFHDAIYNPFSSTNELDSAKLAVNFLNNNAAGEQQCNDVYDLIMATLHTARVEALDQKLLVDIDLSILGTSAEVYAQFEKNVRKEYRWVPMPIYRRKRKKILNDFLSREVIFQTAYFREKFEADARKNLLRAIGELTT